MNKNAKVASLNLIGRFVRLIAAPMTLLVISKNLTSEELAYYYTFFSLLSMQQLVELGIGHVIKQYISHNFKIKDHIWTKKSKRLIKGYHELSKRWFYLVAAFLMFFVGIVGYFYFGIKETAIDWEYPWFFVVISSAVATFIIPMQILLDGTQKQEVYLKANILAGLVSSLSLWIALHFGFGLYSIAISSIFNSLAILFLILKPYREINREIKDFGKRVNINLVFKEVSPLLFRVSSVWAMGFLFWNSFNVISFLIMDPKTAGNIIFTVALARAGFGIAESITQGQATIFSNLIGNNEARVAKLTFNKYYYYSLGVLILGYSLFFVIWSLFPKFYIFEKVTSEILVFQIFLFFSLQLIKQLRNNFVRCFKIEPFIKPSAFEAFLLPVVFYFCGVLIPGIMFIGPMVVIVIGALWSFHIEKKLYRSYAL